MNGIAAGIRSAEVPIDYLNLSLSDVRRELDVLARDAQSAFGGLDERRLNWRPSDTQWSVAQCLEHVLNANREMIQAMDAALDPSRRRSVWQRLPVMPGLFGRALIRSQMPETTRKFKAPATATPASSSLDAGIFERFVEQQRAAVARVRRHDPGVASSTVMVSPFVSFIAYTVLDGWRLIVTHERRHFEQARRVTQSPGFPT